MDSTPHANKMLFYKGGGRTKGKKKEDSKNAEGGSAHAASNPSAADTVGDSSENFAGSFVNLVHRLLLLLGLQNFGRDGAKCDVLSRSHSDLACLVHQAIAEHVIQKRASAIRLHGDLSVGRIVASLMAYDQAPHGERNADALVWRKQGTSTGSNTALGFIDPVTAAILKDSECMPVNSTCTMILCVCAKELNFDVLLSQIVRPFTNPIRVIMLVLMRSSMFSKSWAVMM